MTGRGDGGVAILGRCGRASTRRSLVILDLVPWGLVAAERVGLVIGPRLPSERFHSDTSQAHPLRPGSIGPEAPRSGRRPAHVRRSVDSQNQPDGAGRRQTDGPRKPTILVVTEDPEPSEAMSAWLREAGLRVVACPGPQPPT
jgi:hypothetical protein